MKKQPDNSRSWDEQSDGEREDILSLVRMKSQQRNLGTPRQDFISQNLQECRKLSIDLAVVTKQAID